MEALPPIRTKGSLIQKALKPTSSPNSIKTPEHQLGVNHSEQLQAELNHKSYRIAF